MRVFTGTHQAHTHSTYVPTDIMDFLQCIHRDQCTYVYMYAHAHTHAPTHLHTHTHASTYIYCTHTYMV